MLFSLFLAIADNEEFRPSGHGVQSFAFALRAKG
jgi:hypothetical protein